MVPPVSRGTSHPRVLPASRIGRANATDTFSVCRACRAGHPTCIMATPYRRSMEPRPLPAAATEPAPRELPAERSAGRLAIPPGVLLFVATTFASAFLIFLVQPIVGKRIVPWFGGVPAVWSLCLAFYQ